MIAVQNKIVVFLLAFLATACNCRKSLPEKPAETAESTELTPRRIVSLSPAATEILCSIGAFDRIVARSDFCDYPESVKKIPSAGGFDGKTISLETILSFNPDFVYLTKGMHSHLVPLLQAQGIQIYLSDADSVRSVLEEIMQIGKITGNLQKAKDIRESIQKDLDEIAETNKSLSAVKVYWEVWAPPYMSAGQKSFINELISCAGGQNIFSEINQAYPVVSDEAIISANPQVIFIPDTMKDGVLSVKKRSGWQNIDAVKNSRIYSMNADIISRPGPRIAQAVKNVSEKIH